MEEKQSLKERIHNQEYHEILTGKYPANQILTERSLMEKYGVSKAPIREALVQLCSEEMLQSIPRCGYQITQITPRQLEEGLEVRCILELGALEHCFYKLDERHIQRLEENVIHSQSITYDHEVDKHWKMNMGFHLLLCSFANNTLLDKALEQNLNYCSRGAYRYFNTTWDKQKLSDASQHARLIETIKSKSLENAKEILVEDILSMRTSFQMQ
ncbi:transcriptional regulator [Sphaerochaeta pleomorpha str. Grapes]|uniref:Transcriptional regulator n=1 Tax=Sphaerochaeta pleomorpha (strain ATCC BAA-1885 / DSM 22778 / Grapes) TaxID=158190 RepID=G8QTP7_SPHPG|nr:GntR family transcriptional regulator [Sphaerochaeta pleomorpha]AEV28012.1 transcriptional regulator [Sphaerochaeta pleomorpha str. Grapes]